MAEAEHCFNDDPHRDDQQRRGVEQRGEDLPPQIAVGLALLPGLPRQPGDEQGQAERGAVGEHMTSVGEQRQRVREPSADSFTDEKKDGEKKEKQQKQKTVGGAKGRVY